MICLYYKKIGGSGFMVRKNHGYCIINGRVENLSEVQEMLDSGKKINGEIIRIMMNKYGLEPIDAYMFEELVLEAGIPANYDEILKQRDLEVAQRPSSKPHCPHCGSTNIEQRQFVSLPGYALIEYWYCNNCHSTLNI